MIGYTTIGTNDMAKARAFYDPLMGEIGAKRIMEEGDRLTIWGLKPGVGMLAMIQPHNGEAATVGNGTMVAIMVDDTETVAKLYAKALELGGSDEGAPGPRGAGVMNFAYCRDPEGNKLAFYCMIKKD